MTSDWIGALTVGFLGAGHCLGMCGGIASAVSLTVSANKPKPAYLTTLLYNLGRLCAYMLAGAVIGGAISSLAQLASYNTALGVLRLVAAAFMIMLALYLGKWWYGLLIIEQSGQFVWKWLSPVGKKLLPLRSPLHAFPFGFIWGWLPCGLVYSMLTWAAVAGSALDGAMVMLAFGVGTLPSMLLIGMGATRLRQWQKSVWFRQTGAVLLLVYGLYSGYDAIKILS